MHWIFGRILVLLWFSVLLIVSVNPNCFVFSALGPWQPFGLSLSLFFGVNWLLASFGRWWRQSLWYKLHSQWCWRVSKAMEEWTSFDLLLFGRFQLPNFSFHSCWNILKPLQQLLSLFPERTFEFLQCLQKTKRVDGCTILKKEKLKEIFEMQSYYSPRVSAEEMIHLVKLLQSLDPSEILLEKQKPEIKERT